MAKYGLIIQDMDADELFALLEKIETGAIVVERATITDDRRDEILSTDIEGLQWDDRIHAGSRKKNADGTWKRKKGLTEEEFKVVYDQIKPQPAFTPDVLIAPAHLLAPVAVDAVLPPVEAVTMAPPPMPFSPVIPAPVAVEAAPPAPVIPTTPARDFQGLMLQISRLFATQRIKPEYPQTVLTRVNGGFKTNLVTITDIANDPRMVEYAWQCLDVDKMGV